MLLHPLIYYFLVNNCFLLFFRSLVVAFVRITLIRARKNEEAEIKAEKGNKAGAGQEGPLAASCHKLVVSLPVSLSSLLLLLLLVLPTADISPPRI